MLSRQSVRVTYAHKKRRVQNASKKLLSSPLEVLPPEMDDLTRTQMARRMLKRSRRVALAEQLEDKNVEHIREHLSKRIKRNQERVPNVEPVAVPFDMLPQDDITFRTPFSTPHSIHESAIVKPLVPEQLSPVPATKRIMSRTSSMNLKENSTQSQSLASPFSSRPGSAASSPKHKGRGRSSRRALRSSLHTKSRTLSGVFKENVRRVSRKNSTVSLRDTNRERQAKYINHHRYPSSPSTSYMRSQFPQEDWIVPPKALSRTFDDYDAITSPGGSFHSDASFYAAQPQSCSTPAISRLGKAPDLRGREARINIFFASPSLCQDPTKTGGLDVDMMDNTVPPRRQTIHLSGNSIFSSSDEFTIGSLPAINNGTTIADKNDAIDRDDAPARVARQVFVRREVVSGSQAGRPSAGSFVAEYDIPLSDMACSPVSIPATKTLGPGNIPKLSVGEQLFGLPGTSPAHGGSLVVRTCRGPVTLTPPASPSNAIAPCPPSSPASDLAQEFGSMDIRGDLNAHSDGETCRPSAPIPLLTRAHSLQDALAEPTTKPIKRKPARNRAGTIRASDFVKPGPGASSSGGVSGPTASSLSNVRRTRSGTVVGLDLRLATKGAGTKAAPPTGLAAVQSGSESESDDELLLKAAWTDDLEYLGLAVPIDKDAEADEMNLGGPRTGPPRRLGLRRR